MFKSYSQTPVFIKNDSNLILTPVNQRLLTKSLVTKNYKIDSLKTELLLLDDCRQVRDSLEGDLRQSKRMSNIKSHVIKASLLINVITITILIIIL